jgi:hypothetical protein
MIFVGNSKSIQFRKLFIIFRSILMQRLSIFGAKKAFVFSFIVWADFWIMEKSWNQAEPSRHHSDRVPYFLGHGHRGWGPLSLAGSLVLPTITTTPPYLLAEHLNEAKALFSSSLLTQHHLCSLPPPPPHTRCHCGNEPGVAPLQAPTPTSSCTLTTPLTWACRWDVVHHDEQTQWPRHRRLLPPRRKHRYQTPLIPVKPRRCRHVGLHRPPGRATAALPLQSNSCCHVGLPPVSLHPLQAPKLNPLIVVLLWVPLPNILPPATTESQLQSPPTLPRA